MRILTGIYSPKTNEYTDCSENIVTYKNNNYSIAVFGDVVINNTINSFETIIECYKKNGNRITEYINGLYILIVYDKEQNILSIFHDRTTSPITLYYTFSKGVLYFSTSLKRLLLLSRIERKLNESVIEDFIINGFLYGKQTLLENVYKINSFHCLNVSVNGATQKPVNYSYTIYSELDAHNRFKEVLDKAIIKQAKDMTEVNAPLSSGYDSSYIVDVFSKQTSLPINAFSIGGKFGKNELPIVEQNVNYFNRTSLISEITDSSTLQNYPDIVWRLDGNVYESGLFLQYELNKLVHEKEKNTLICGECADQVLNQYYFSDERNAIPEDNSEPVYYEFSDYPYIFSSYLIYKKNGIMANSFDIITKYPYLDNEFVALCKSLAEYNGKTKRKHKENCKECLPREIIDNISKIGGATECHSLFNDESEIKRFFCFVESSEFYKKHKVLIKKHSYSEKIKPSFSIAAKTIIRNILYKLMKKEIDKTGNYFNEEILLREHLNYTYLILFNELFISGKYDEEFKNQGIDYKLDKFM